MQLTPEQVKGRIKNVAKENKADARTLMRIYMMERFLERVANSQYKDNFIIKGGMLVTAMVGVALRSTMDIDTDVLKKAFEATCKKRSTENLKEEAPKIMADVSDDAQLHTLWKSYQKKYPYAADISYEDIMESTMFLWSKIQ